MAESTLLFNKAPSENVIVLGHVQDANGQKMSKSKGNAVDPVSYTHLDVYKRQRLDRPYILCLCQGLDPPGIKAGNLCGNTERCVLFAQAGIPNPHTLLGKPLETVMNGLTLDTVLKEASGSELQSSTDGCPVA